MTPFNPHLETDPVARLGVLRPRVGPADDVEVACGGSCRGSFRDGKPGTAAREDHNRDGAGADRYFDCSGSRRRSGRQSESLGWVRGAPRES